VAAVIEQPTIVQAAGSPPKTIREHVGRVNTGTDAVSVAHMSSPAGWAEPWQTPQFDEWTLVLSGSVLVEHDSGTFAAHAGQTVHAPRDHRIRYSTPDGADYVAVCIPAFSPDLVHRDSDGPTSGPTEG
jgi:quercetin dioxygenase-like cupin family protein